MTILEVDSESFKREVTLCSQWAPWVKRFNTEVLPLLGAVKDPDTRFSREATFFSLIQGGEMSQDSWYTVDHHEVYGDPNDHYNKEAIDQMLAGTYVFREIDTGYSRSFNITIEEVLCAAIQRGLIVWPHEAVNVRVWW